MTKTTKILSSSYRAALLAQDGEEQEVMFVPDFGSDFETVIAGVNLLQPTTRYRGTSIGKSLTETLDELMAEGKITAKICEKCLRQFDRSILSRMSEELTPRMTFKASKLAKYKFMDNEWTFVLKDVEFREFHSFINVSKLKISAFEARIAGGLKGGSKRRWKKDGCDNSRKRK